ncbi:hypothetical protein BV25DRAFT_1817100 [Artomyces pyxidatus]|uniref:Uncharacterized protein n=1 Tax=Artomyces pyxidatus TaxID=48021 RepID=A0ACB8SDR7_9AGAM|nr:hypothetical protein BV25DRAFT_1817100 [Artomyces pyxidatus]
MKRLDDYAAGPDFASGDGWKHASVHLRLPCEGVTNASEEEAPTFEVKGVYYRSLTEVIKSAFQETVAKTFHFTPFQLLWHHSENPEDPPVRLISELYNSDAFIEEHEKIRSQPRDCTLETAVAAIMPASDSTHLANFGTASLWPIYAFFGNQSKYDRGKPSNFAAHHLAYLPSLPDTIQDAYRAIFGKSATAAVLTHLKRDLIHEIWELLLDEDFMHAYVHGIVILCADGITRRIFPRFFTYSADYPEKVLLASIKSLAACPCPCCFVKKDQIGALGTHADRLRRMKPRVDDARRQDKVETTRRWIFERGYAIACKAVQRVLDPLSMVPTRNAFSKRLSSFGFDFHSMFVPDLLHEFELGVWKAVFTHLLRLLYAIGGDAIQKLNKRYSDFSQLSHTICIHLADLQVSTSAYVWPRHHPSLQQ